MYKFKNTLLAKVIENFTAEELKELEKDGLVKKVKAEMWRQGKHKTYFYADMIGRISRGVEFGDAVDDFLYSIGNYFRTAEEAEKYKARLLAEQSLRDECMRLRGDWKPSFGSTKVSNHVIRYTHGTKTFTSNSYNYDQNTPSLFYLPSEKAVESLINTHEKELRIYFEIE